MPPFDLELYERLRSSEVVGARVLYVERSASTMDDARAGADRSEPCGTAYVAGEQSAGRGRQGRSWLSGASAGLYVTYHLCPGHIEAAPLLSVAGALAASLAILEASGVATELKWPNDVLHGGRKLCGVLAESRVGAGVRLDVFLGLGINVRTSEMPPEVAAIATSIEAAGGPVPALEALLAVLSSALERYTEMAETAPATLLEDFRARLVTLGRRVRLQAPGRVVEGEAVDVTPRGELVLRLDDGQREAFAAGDVTTLR